MTPTEALDLIDGFMEGASLDYARDNRPDVRAAVDTLHGFIKQWTGHDCEDVIPWGEAGDCFERIVNDPDIGDALVEAGVDRALVDKAFSYQSSKENNEFVLAKVKELGLGEHYGNPHCIWCLQGD